MSSSSSAELGMPTAGTPQTAVSSKLSARDLGSVFHHSTHLAAHAGQGPFVITRGRGVWVWDQDGNAYIEGMSGLWCVSLGFGVDELADAAASQMRELAYAHSFAGRSHPRLIELSERLLALAPCAFDKVFLATSGSEATDTAVKLIRYFNNAVGRPAKKKIIGRQLGFHGVTGIAASVTGIPANHRDFDLPLPGFLHTLCPHYYRYGKPGESEAEFSDSLVDSVDQLIQAEGPDTVAAFFAEPVMGAGGVLIPPSTYFNKLQAVLKRHDVFLVADEVICGFGRTGNRWGSETYGIKPDFLITAKQLSSGYQPIAALLVPQRVYSAVERRTHDSGVFGHGMTFGGHPVAAAVALKTLELYDRLDIIRRVQELAPAFARHMQRFESLEFVGEVRYVGLMGAIEFVASKEQRLPHQASLRVAETCIKLARAEGLIIRAVGQSVVLCPPLVITEDELDQLFERLGKAVNALGDYIRNTPAQLPAN